MSSKPNVAYYYDEEIGNYYFGPGHPMKPHRMRMAHKLVVEYGLYKKMTIYKPYPLLEAEMTQFHADDYIEFLSTITPDRQAHHEDQLVRYLKKDEHGDCPVFHGLFEFCSKYCGGSVGGATRLLSKEHDIVVNWAGGLHHAKKAEAAGFCYVNDIVLAILELLKEYPRVLYIDIDIHHGDGVEEAFYTTDRVMTLSFHKDGDFFPGTGKLGDKGLYNGKHYSLNFPMKEGIGDDKYRECFRPVVSKVVEFFKPAAIVLQAGADSLAGDRLGCFNLSMSGHGDCVEFVKSFGLPMLVLGGGGYTIRNVARCWANETAICCGEKLENTLPFNDYYEYYAPDYKLFIQPCDMIDFNDDKYLTDTTSKLLEYLHEIPHAPSVAIHNSAPKMPYVRAEKLEAPPDVRMTDAQRAAHVEHEGEMFDSERDQAGEENGVGAAVVGAGPAPMSIVPTESPGAAPAPAAASSSSSSAVRPLRDDGTEDAKEALAPSSSSSTSSPGVDLGEGVSSAAASSAAASPAAVASSAVSSVSSSAASAPGGSGSSTAAARALENGVKAENGVATASSQSPSASANGVEATNGGEPSKSNSGGGGTAAAAAVGAPGTPSANVANGGSGSGGTSGGSGEVKKETTAQNGVPSSGGNIKS